MSTASRRSRASEILKEPDDTPLLIQRCILSILSEDYATGKTDLERFTSAVDICLASFEKNGLVGSDTMKLTGDGLRSQNKKRRAPDKNEKAIAWGRLTRKLQLQEQKQDA